MNRRKRETEPDETGETLSEDTREMWTVAGPAEPSGPGSGPGRTEDGEPDSIETPEAGGEDWFVDQGGDPDEGRERSDQAEDGRAEGEDPDDEYFEDEDDWYDEEDDPVEVDGEPYDEELELSGDGWNEDEQPEPAGSSGTERRRSFRAGLEAIPWPDFPDPDPRQLLAGVAVGAVTLAAGFGAYQLGRSGGPDLDTARIQGEAAGRQAGAIEGASAGYPAGYRKGREKGFGRAYRRAYRIYYRRAFEQAGLAVPGEGEIEVPSP